MGTGQFPTASLELVLGTISKVPGAFGEVGVWQGNLFTRLCKAAAISGRTAFAFDSFVGMDTPSEFDGGVKSTYPKGRFSIGGVVSFDAILKQNACTSYQLFDGYIPECFSKFDTSHASVKFSFLYIDVDHYEPTKKAIEWGFEKVAVGGVIGFDDFWYG
jgi:O-methyltransferase